MNVNVNVNETRKRKPRLGVLPLGKSGIMVVHEERVRSRSRSRLRDELHTSAPSTSTLDFAWQAANDVRAVHPADVSFVIGSPNTR